MAGYPPGPTNPYPMPGSLWQKPGVAGQPNLPSDYPPGIPATQAVGVFGLDSGQKALTFWDSVPESLDPSNARFNEWDVVTIAGMRLPGLCTVNGGRGQKLDPKPVKGEHYATITAQGRNFAKLTIIERIWTQEQLDALQRILPILEAPTATIPSTGNLTALDIQHPALALRGITSVVVENIGLLHWSSVRGVMEQEIRVWEYKPVNKKQNGTGTFSGTVKVAIQGVSNVTAASAPTPPMPPSSNPKDSAALRQSGG